MTTNESTSNLYDYEPDPPGTPGPDGARAAEMAQRSGRVADAKAEQQRKLNEKAGDAEGGFDPGKHIEDLDRENAERHAADDAIENTVAPFEMVPPQYKELADTYHREVTELAAAAGISSQETEVMLHLAMGGAMEAVGRDMGAALEPGQVPGVDLSNRSQCMTYMTRRYGKETADAIVSQAIKGFAALPRSIQEYLDRDHGTGELLTNSPHVLLALAARNLGWTGLSKESAAKEMAELGKKGKLDPFDLEKRRILGHIISRGKKGEDAKLLASAKKAAKPAAPSVRSKLEAELRTIRQDKQYYTKGGAHDALVARVNAIYQELHGGK